MSIAGVTGCEVIAAEWRVWSSEVSSPSRIQSVRSSGSPLSKTDDSLPDAAATLNGSHWSPSYAGSLNRLTPGAVIVSPIRVPVGRRL